MLSLRVYDYMVRSQLIKPASVNVYHDPFPYFTAMAALDRDVISSSLTWLESEARWKLVVADFYEQYELSSTEDQLPELVSSLTSPVLLNAIRQDVGDLFHRSFASRVSWSIHKLLAGQRIRIHNDLLANGETHRVILHLNQEWSITQGGFLMLFNSANPVDVHRVLMPLAGSLVGFEISEKSNHAVSLIHGGERFSVVYSLYADG